MELEEVMCSEWEYITPQEIPFVVEHIKAERDRGVSDSVESLAQEALDNLRYKGNVMATIKELNLTRVVEQLYEFFLRYSRDPRDPFAAFDRLFPHLKPNTQIEFVETTDLDILFDVSQGGQVIDPRTGAVVGKPADNTEVSTTPIVYAHVVPNSRTLTLVVYQWFNLSPRQAEILYYIRAKG